jgi:dimethylhistidine N-methyltransferase
MRNASPTPSVVLPDAETAGAVADGRIRFLVQSTQDPLADDGPNVIHNLSKTPKKISPVYVYDQLGTRLFERQCRTPEYYLRRAEARVLNAHASEILDLCGCLPMVELGAGTAEKTRILLREYHRRNMPCDYFPIDVDTQTLLAAAGGLVRDYPRLTVHIVGAGYGEGLSALPPGRRARLLLFLGSSLANMELSEMNDLLDHIYRHTVSGDHLLVGLDLDKDAAVINKAYNDAAGFGAYSTLNMLSHLNRRYGGDFIIERYAYRSTFNVSARRNEVRIESLAQQTVTLRRLDFQVSFRPSEMIDAEVMWKFDPQDVAHLLGRAGFSPVQRWIEPVHRYGVFLFRHP